MVGDPYGPGGGIDQYLQQLMAGDNQYMQGGSAIGAPKSPTAPNAPAGGLITGRLSNVMGKIGGEKGSKDSGPGSNIGGDTSLGTMNIGAGDQTGVGQMRVNNPGGVSGSGAGAGAGSGAASGMATGGAAGAQLGGTAGSAAMGAAGEGGSWLQMLAAML